VIEGFPRSGNTYARAFFSLSQKDGFKLASHLHSPSHLYLAWKYQVPALLLIRNPLDTAVSNMTNEPYVHPNQVLKNWLRFYEGSLKYKDAFLAVDFEALISNFRGVVEKLNQRFEVGFNTEKINALTHIQIFHRPSNFYPPLFGSSLCCFGIEQKREHLPRKQFFIFHRRPHIDERIRKLCNRPVHVRRAGSFDQFDQLDVHDVGNRNADKIVD
ncbi:MAG: sulfotransferase domain-containing protein, partial [Planctomycetes bacterium]|nr:sulfotransferase domain-containing protein [Planctomycetota bacterium]